MLTADTKLSILVVDDNDDYLEILQMVLDDQEFSVTTTRSPETAMSLLESKAFDVVISDLHFGSDSEMIGIEFTKGFVSRYGGNYPIIGVTGNVAEVALLDWMAAGAYKVLSKPFPVAVLVDTLRGAAMRGKAAKQS